jgi:hypothetical protein
MTNFTANNDSAISKIFEERVLYEFFAFGTSTTPIPRDPAGIKNYWRFENGLYGKVDKNLIVIQPNINFLSTIRGQENVNYALAPVAESFLDFQNSFKIPAQSGRLAEDNYLNAPEVFRSYIDSEDSYNTYVTDIIGSFNTNKVLTKPLNDEIRNIKDYAREFFKHVLNDMTTPITRVSYVLSSKVSTMNSGLSIEISDLNPSDNSDKQSFIQSPNFDFYQQTAINSGFLIDKNIPWRLNFDLSSPANREKISPLYASPDIAASFLNRYFDPVYERDIEYLISLVVVGYNSLVASKKYYMEGKCKILRTQIEKEKVLKDVLPPYYWTKRYCQLRNKESGGIYTEPEIEKIIQYALDLQDSGLEYIDSKFRIPYLFEGSTVYQRLKEYYLEKNNFSLDNFSDHVTMIIKNSINKIY